MSYIWWTKKPKPRPDLSPLGPARFQFPDERSRPLTNSNYKVAYFSTPMKYQVSFRAKTWYLHMWKYHHCYDFIINRTIQTKFRCAHSRNIFQHSKRNFVSPRGHVISSNLFKNYSMQWPIKFKCISKEPARSTPELVNMASSKIGRPKMGLLFHSFAAGLYAFTFYHELTLNLPNRATYGGRWKFLTILNLVR